MSSTPKTINVDATNVIELRITSEVVESADGVVIKSENEEDEEEEEPELVVDEDDDDEDNVEVIECHDVVDNDNDDEEEEEDQPVLEKLPRPVDELNCQFW